jgi:hypothetical protein
MSDWVDVLSDSRPIRSIFGEHSPSLRTIVVHDLTIGRDGPSLCVRFDISEYPTNPPVKWVRTGVNRVQIRIIAFGVRDLTINGASSEMMANLELRVDGSRVQLGLDGRGFQVKAIADAIILDRISAYADGDAGPR